MRESIQTFESHRMGDPDICQAVADGMKQGATFGEAFRATMAKQEEPAQAEDDGEPQFISEKLDENNKPYVRWVKSALRVRFGLNVPLAGLSLEEMADVLRHESRDEPAPFEVWRL
jgi:hypothetical protein